MSRNQFLLIYSNAQPGRIGSFIDTHKNSPIYYLNYGNIDPIQCGSPYFLAHFGMDFREYGFVLTSLKTKTHFTSQGVACLSS